MQTSVWQEAEKCKIADYREVKFELSVRCPLISWISAFLLDISSSYLPRPSNRQSMSKIEFSTAASISLIWF